MVVATTSTSLPRDPVSLSSESTSPFQDTELNNLWTKALLNDKLLISVRRAIETGARTLLNDIKVKIQAGNYTID